MRQRVILRWLADGLPKRDPAAACLIRYRVQHLPSPPSHPPVCRGALHCHCPAAAAATNALDPSAPPPLPSAAPPAFSACAACSTAGPMRLAGLWRFGRDAQIICAPSITNAVPSVSAAPPPTAAGAAHGTGPARCVSITETEADRLAVLCVTPVAVALAVAPAARVWAPVSDASATPARVQGSAALPPIRPDAYRPTTAPQASKAAPRALPATGRYCGVRWRLRHRLSERRPHCACSPPHRSVPAN